MSDLADLREFAAADGPFVTVAIPARSDVADARHRFEVNWRTATGRLDDSWSADEIGRLDELVMALDHDGGASLVVSHASGGPTLVEFLDDPVREPAAVEGAVPRLTTIIDSRQRSRPHVVVEADRAGADITAFDGGQLLGADHVEGDRLHIHRGHPGGWSQRRFQQRAENTWERNADDVAGFVSDVDRRVGAERVFVAGDVRACSLVLDALPSHVREHAVKIEAGSPEGIADEVVRSLADLVAREFADLSERLGAAIGDGRATAEPESTLQALVEGRVEHLLVRGGTPDDEVTSTEVAGVPAGAHVVDTAVAAALRTDADVTVVPTLAVMEGPVASLLRW